MSANFDTKLRRNDVLILVAFCLLFFGFSLVGGRPLTMHEGVLPQSAREMYVDHDWVVPKNGGRPWLESPPLPQWVTVGIATVMGRCDAVWVVRIGPALMGLCSVLLVAWMAAGWFGRKIGLFSGLILATVYEFAQYAWLAEDEIFLCALVTAAIAQFVRIEFFREESAALGSRNFFGARTWNLLALFVLLGLTNLAKGLLFGTVMSLVPIAAFLLWNSDLRRITYYFWLWGWLAFAAIAIAWPLAAWIRYPDVLDLWLYDHKGRLDGGYVALSEPFWYYLKVLPGEIAPWTLVAPFGMWVTRQRALQQRFSAERFVWGWAILTPLVFSIPTGKHHHYLLHCLAPWAILAAIGLDWLQAKIVAWPKSWWNPFQSLVMNHARVAGGVLFGLVALAYCGGHYAAGAYFDRCRQDTAFLKSVRASAPADVPLLVNCQTGSLDEFRMLFYLNDKTIPLHNLSFLADDRIAAREVFVVARAKEADQLAKFGIPTVVLQSTQTRREKSPGDRLTLFHLEYADHVVRVPTRDLRISPMQAAQRADGPVLGVRQ